MSKVRKALVAGALAVIAYLTATVTTTGKIPTAADVGAAVGAGVVVAIATWRVPNAVPAPPA